jgi:hypothetical protein
MGVLNLNVLIFVQMGCSALHLACQRRLQPLALMLLHSGSHLDDVDMVGSLRQKTLLVSVCNKGYQSFFSEFIPSWKPWNLGKPVLRPWNPWRNGYLPFSPWIFINLFISKNVNGGWYDNGFLLLRCASPWITDWIKDPDFSQNDYSYWVLTTISGMKLLMVQMHKVIIQKIMAKMTLSPIKYWKLFFKIFQK